jgi:undecaprenyl-diphosphatase
LVHALILLALCVALTDQIASHLIKNWVQRLRPSHEPSLSGLVHLVNGYRGGKFGFVSSHAANSFGIALFLFFLLRKSLPQIGYILFPWAIAVSYSRIYLGVHYPADILGGALIGLLTGWGLYSLFHWVEQKNWSSDKALKPPESPGAPFPSE